MHSGRPCPMSRPVPKRNFCPVLKIFGKEISSLKSHFTVEEAASRRSRVPPYAFSKGRRWLWRARSERPLAF